RWNMPFHSAYVTTIGAILISCINFGSTIGLAIIVSVGLLALLSTYLISIGCVLWRRLTNQRLSPARWSLGRWAIPINLFAFVYTAFPTVWCCFPPKLPVDAASANWSPLVWVAVVIVSMLGYLAYGEKHYTAPVEFVE
ncbi:hypothetical protein DOTSEDRAFT_101821, partial [Dothistroma septosporum NZE10]